MKRINLIIYLFSLVLSVQAQYAIRYLDSIHILISTDQSNSLGTADQMLHAEVLHRFCTPHLYGKYINEIEKIMQANPNELRLKGEYNLLKSSILRKEGKYDESYLLALEVKKIGEQIFDTLILVRALNHLSSLNNKISSGNTHAVFKSAKEWSQNSVLLAEKTKDIYTRSLARQMHAANLMAEKNNSEAFAILNKNQEEILAANPSILMDICLSYNYCLKGLSAPDETVSENMYKKSYELSNDAGFMYIKSLVSHNLAHSIFIPKQQYGEAIFYLKEGVTLSATGPEKLNSLKSLIQTLTAGERYKEAAYYVSEYITLRDSVEAKENDSKFLALQTQYETIQKENEITKLSLENSKKDTRLKLITALAVSILLLMILFFIMMMVVNKWRVKAEREGKIKDKLFSMVAHDIRSPIMGLQYAVPALRQQLTKGTNTMGEKLLNSLQLTINDLQILVENVFQWAKINNGLAISITKFNLMLETTQVIEAMEHKAAMRGIRLSFLNNSKDEHPMIESDRIIIITVIRNILDNAIKYSPENEMVSIELTNTIKTFQLHIRDAGVGIDEAVAKNLFTLSGFGTDHAHIEHGSGIGLAICKVLLDHLGEKIWIEKKDMDGAHFVIELNKVHHV